MNKMQRFAFTSLAFSALLFISPSAFASEEEIGSELEPVSVEVDSYEPLYADVSEQHFAKAAIRFLSERGIVSGSTELIRT
ncbi:hypothetical protein JCM9140_3605 [Halalkalibacter wakoensis JCM 9140]|uniref:SLH domain-containing protein n=1 Tax=Halalkalibacter wakoensis JCM 9140 TaxID=1236970 RepID=W4Q711_9BACI|nr:hypothetical protein [Halalkalibacter wakoensis]GAE27458.1 hypothetical protein JCM9140_3605 [Halalkalibacter wakoensis JCM 9140]